MSIDADVQLCHSETAHGDKLRLRSWITVQLIGEDDAPIAGEAYAIELPGGRIETGNLGADGTVTLRGIPAGRCRVSFPELDKEAWTTVDTQSGDGNGSDAAATAEGKAA